MIIDSHVHVFGPCEKGISTEERLLEHMDQNGVDKAILIGNPYYGFFNEVTKACCQHHPERFQGVALVDVRKGAAAAKELEGLYQEGTLFGMAIESASTFAGMPDARMLSPLTEPVWEVIGAYQQPVFLHMFRHEDLVDLAELSARYPDCRFICCHLGADACHGKTAAKESFSYLLNLAKQRDNILFDTSSLPDYYVQQYPFTESCGVIEYVWNQMGAERLLWGTDYPGMLNYARYDQLMDIVRKDCKSIPPREIDLIMGQNAYDVFWNKN